MRSEAPALMPIFRSRHQAELLALLLLHPDQSYTLTQIAAQIKASLSAVHTEVQRLIDAGILTSHTVGRSRLVSADTNSQAAEALTELMVISFGPRVAIAEEFADLAGAERVLIYGSWARRYQGERGSPPNDVDVLVMGDVERAEVYDAADRAQQRMSIPVNVTIASNRRWFDSSDALIQEIKASPTVTIIGGD